MSGLTDIGGKTSNLGAEQRVQNGSGYAAAGFDGIMPAARIGAETSSGSLAQGRVRLGADATVRADGERNGSAYAQYQVTDGGRSSSLSITQNYNTQSGATTTVTGHVQQDLGQRMSSYATVALSTNPSQSRVEVGVCATTTVPVVGDVGGCVGIQQGLNGEKPRVVVGPRITF